MPGVHKRVAICPHCRQIVNALSLTWQQWEVASKLINGETMAEIARALFICVKTVEAHRQRIFEVLEIKNVPQLIRWANDRGLLPLMGWRRGDAVGDYAGGIVGEGHEENP